MVRGTGEGGVVQELVGGGRQKGESGRRVGQIRGTRVEGQRAACRRGGKEETGKLRKGEETSEKKE